MPTMQFRERWDNLRFHLFHSGPRRMLARQLKRPRLRKKPEQVKRPYTELKSSVEAVAGQYLPGFQVGTEEYDEVKAIFDDILSALRFADTTSRTLPTQELAQAAAAVRAVRAGIKELRTFGIQDLDPLENAQQSLERHIRQLADQLPDGPHR